jgi:hypothetical protein
MLAAPVVYSFEYIGGKPWEPIGLLKFPILGVAFAIVDATHDWRLGK